MMMMMMMMMMMDPGSLYHFPYLRVYYWLPPSVNKKNKTLMSISV